jgi:hypothetical protein
MSLKRTKTTTEPDWGVISIEIVSFPKKNLNSRSEKGIH